MAHLAWAAISVASSRSPTLDDGPPPMATPGARRNSVNSWSDCTTLVDLPAISQDFSQPVSPGQQGQDPSAPLVPRLGGGRPLIAGDWSDPWNGTWQPFSGSDERGKRKRMAQTWLRVKTRILRYKGDGALASGEASPASPSSDRRLDPRALPRDQMPSSPIATAPNRRSLRTRRSASFSSSANSNRYSWQSTSSTHTTSPRPTVDLVWGSMTAGFII